MQKVTHEQLWNFAQQIAWSEVDCYRSMAFDPIGLALRPTPLLNEYPSPYNGFQFADTGGDSVCFSYLKQGDEDFSESPIIMSVPCADNSEVIVGENLFDFLCLGSQLGFFYLEQYVYNLDDFLRLYRHPEVAWQSEEMYERQNNDADNWRSASTQQELLQLLRDEFSLRPWYNIEQRMAQLQDDYLKLVQPCIDWDFEPDAEGRL